MPPRYRPSEQGVGTAGDATDDLDWGTAIGYYGVPQVLGLGLPAVMLVFQSPLDRGLLASAALTACGATILALAVGRKRVVVGDRWPTLTNRKLGVDSGYWSFLRRHAHVTATLTLATFAGVVAGRLAESPALVATALVVAVVGVALVPRLAADDRTARLARGGFYAAGLATTAVFARPFDLSVAAVSAPVVFSLVTLAAAADVLLAPAGTDPRS